MLKIVLAVCLLQVALCWEDWEKMSEPEDKKHAWMMMMMKGWSAHDMGDHSKCEHKMEEGSGDKKDMMMHYQYMMMKKKKEEAKKEEFMKFMKHYKEMKEKHEWEDKQKAMELFKKKMMLKEKTDQLGEVEEMMKSFMEKKHKFVFTLTSNFLKLCKCSDVTAQITRFFSMGASTGDMIGDIISPEALQAMESGDNVELAKIIHKMSHDEQKAIFFKGLIKSMCAGAKTFVRFTKQFEETYMKANSTAMP
ncbi:uncharacterized protein LOC121390664 [Gigantopelta aegis]|uniref:uncharacterized protein LOC121390664 n=1 Tax=Gigantopelta aegis TaxID=1735272 RepID=UPI001B88D340|nr:uncharacterized protein LOC121390664 [Gigantopelta aegis]